MRDIPNFEGMYAATKCGKIWSYPKSTNHKLSGKFLRPRILKKSGYIRVQLCVKGKSKDYYVHRLIALTFLENQKEYKEVNHKNGIKSDNRVSNLEWVNRSQNHKHAFKIGLRVPTGGRGKITRKDYET